MERDVELRVKGHLYEISEVNDEVLENRQGYHMSEWGYQKTLDSVLDVAGVDMVDEVVAYIKEYIREHEERPTNNDVRRKARSLVSKAGYPADDYLNAA
jgi:gamma-glutamyl phosphate reductase